jgi:hypothetical protein
LLITPLLHSLPILSACGGGTDFLAYAWLLQQNGGSIADEVSYGDYLNQNGFCHYAVNDGLVTNPWNKQPVAQGAKIKVALESFCCLASPQCWPFLTRSLTLVATCVSLPA